MSQSAILHRRRIILVFCGFIFLFSLVLAKSFYLQVIHREKLVAYSQDQVFRESTVYPNRGNIYDRNGNPLAINIRTYSIFTIPKLTDKNQRTYKSLVSIIPQLSYPKIVKKISGRKKYTWLARKIELSEEQVQQVKELKGVFVEEVPKRVYPNQELAAQLIGFVGVENNGLAGLEFLFDQVLKGKPQIVRYLQDAKGRPIKFETKVDSVAAKDITLSIDKDLQGFSEKILKDQVLAKRALRGGIGIINVKNGEILAMANYPTYSADNVKGSDPDARKISFVSDPFEPGSTFKTFTMISALEHKVATSNTKYNCEGGKMYVQGHIISEAEEKEKFGWMTVEDILAHSSNVGTTKVAFDLTYPKLKETISALGVGQKTGIELPSESKGILTSEENVQPLSLSNMSFGQGVATTAIQMLAAYASIANGGMYYPPTIIKDKNKDVVARRVMSEKTATDITDMLAKAVEMGTGTNARIPMYKIAGKTSTAQRVNGAGGYSGYIPGFIGFPVNVENRFVIYVYIEDPKGEYYGNAVAAPVFKKVAEYLLYKNKDIKLAKVQKDLHEADANIDTIKISQSSSRVIGKGIMPNLIGLDKVSAQQILIDMGLNTVGHRGVGVVKEQSPTSGTAISPSTNINLYYAPPAYE